jgi:uncharacterized protein (DUF488 family)
MKAAPPLTIFTVGHSTSEYEQFLAMLRTVDIDAIADVRSSPFSRYNPQFNRESLRGDLARDGIAYVFLGEQLGGRPRNPRYYSNGVADYERMATAEEFEQGLARVIEGARKFRLALMCSESDPLDCHRCLLVGRALANRGVDVKHVLPEGRVEDQAEIEEKLLALEGRDADDFFASREERLNIAYRERARRVAFAEQDSGEPVAAAE